MRIFLPGPELRSLKKICCHMATVPFEGLKECHRLINRAKKYKRKKKLAAFFQIHVMRAGVSHPMTKLKVIRTLNLVNTLHMTISENFAIFEKITLWAASLEKLTRYMDFRIFSRSPSLLSKSNVIFRSYICAFINLFAGLSTTS